jgi:pyruvate/2-oxoacid:ferredoxin oxidoreductase beta subunit
MTPQSQPKKDLGLMAMSYGHVYVAQVALGAKDAKRLANEAAEHVRRRYALYARLAAHA